MKTELKFQVAKPNTYTLIINEELQLLNEELTIWFTEARRLISTDHADSYIKKLSLLKDFRKKLYENLNQLQHRALILKAAQMFQSEYKNITHWTWHPSQTSQPKFADLTGYDKNNNVILNAEITTSMKAIGSIRQRMSKTLESLSIKEGDKFYIVSNESMEKSASKKIKTLNIDIKVKKIEFDN